MWVVPLLIICVGFFLWVKLQRRLSDPKGPMAKAIFVLIVGASIVAALYVLLPDGLFAGRWKPPTVPHPVAYHRTPSKVRALEGDRFIEGLL